MPLTDTSKAIGAVTEALKERLEWSTQVPVSVGRLDKTSSAGGHLNLFLYEIAFDPHLKNTPLHEGGKPPIWLVLKYLLTGFESTEVSDSSKAHEILGSGIRAIYRDDLLTLTGLLTSTTPLVDNPSALHVTFDEAPAELVAKLSQGTDETPRLSVAFQVRPVMIAPAEPGTFSLLVGVDYTKPPIALSAAPVGLDILPSMGAWMEKLEPNGFEVGEVVAILGTDLHLANLSIMLGPVELPVTMQQPDRLEFRIDPNLIGAGGISAGSHPVQIAQWLPGTGKKRKSNAVIGNLVPTLTHAALSALSLTIIPAIPPNVPEKAFATLDLSGLLLGDKNDDVILALYSQSSQGKVYKAFDVFTVLPTPQPALQPSRQLVMTMSDAVPAGDYNVILIVNGQQAPQSPIVRLRLP